MASRRIAWIPWDVLVLLGVYVVAGKLGLRLAFVHASATPVWPPTGIAFAAFLLLGDRVWPAILLGAFLVNLTTAGSVATSVGIAVGNTLEGLAGASLVNRFANGRRVFERAQDIFKFVALAGLLSTAVSATVGVTTLSLGGYASWNRYGAIWLTWWLGDVAGDLVVAPVLVLWSLDHVRRLGRARTWEFALLLGAVAVGGGTVFNGLFAPWVRDYPIEFLCIPPLVLVAFRFGQREAATCIALLSGIAIWGTLRGFGSFVRGTPNESLLLLQAFMGTMVLLALPLGALVAERRRAAGALLALLESAAEGIIIIDASGRMTMVNAAAERMFGYVRDELLGQPLEILLPERVRATHVGHRTGYFEEPRVRPMGIGLDLAGRRKGGTEFPVEISLTYVRSPGQMAAMAFIMDITLRKQTDAALRERDRLRDVASLAAAAAHEINNPLAVIMGRVQLLDRDHEVVQRHRRSMAEILDAVLRVEEITARMRRITRIEMTQESGSLPTMLDLRKSSAADGGPSRSGQPQER